MENTLKSSPKDVFLHLWMVVSLYVSAVALVNLLFDYVSYFIPDIANARVSLDSIRWAVAILLTIFPSYVVVAYLLQKEYTRVPEKRESSLRKWLLYLTLFISAVTLIVDFAVLIYNFLGGELSLRFILDLAAVALVAGVVFGYYIWDLRRQDVKISDNAKLMLRSGLAVVALIIAGAFFMVGSPFEQRIIKIDQQRVWNLQAIQNEIVYNYWQNKTSLPPSLEALRNDISGFVPPLDPETGAPYGYNIKGPLIFELCATFGAVSNVVNDGGMYAEPVTPYQSLSGRKNDVWDHEAGYTCFSRTIDPELFPKPVTAPK